MAQDGSTRSIDERPCRAPLRSPSPRLLHLLALVAGITLSPRDARASSCPGLIEVRVREAKVVAGCPPGQVYLHGPLLRINIDCRTGNLGGPTWPVVCSSFPNPEWPLLGGDPTSYNICGTGSTQVYVLQDCDVPALPPSPSAGCGSNGSPEVEPKAETSKANCVGDPVDLTSGTLEQTPTDLDLGGGLRFTRHYASRLHADSLPSAQVGPLGPKWLHSLAWRLRRHAANGLGDVVWIHRPLRGAVVFYRDLLLPEWKTSSVYGGKVVVDASSVLFTEDDGTRATFDASDRLILLELPGERSIVVSYGTSTQIFARGLQSLTLTVNSSGVNAGRVATVSGGGQSWSYGYDTSQALTTVTGPDPSTPSPSDSIVWTYTYDAPTSEAFLRQLDRVAGGVSRTLAFWEYDANRRVKRVDEPALAFPLRLEYTPAGTPTLTTAKNDAGVELATYTHRSQRLLGTTLLGAPGLPLPFRTATVDTYPDPNNPTLPILGSRWQTKTDLDLHVTLLEGYVRDGAPTRIVEGWVDSSMDGGVGVYSSGDTAARRRELTWHPTLLSPLTVSEVSPLTDELHVATTYDYATPPGERLQGLIRTGKTLDAGGNLVDFTDTTTLGYHPKGKVETIAGPRAENLTRFFYDATSGYGTAVRRYLDGDGSSYLETTFSNFDARGNPQTVVDPNGRVTLFTYDEAGRVRTATPPWAGAGSSTLGFQYDPDGNITRVDFPDDSLGQVHFLRLGHDAKDRLTFVAESNGDALVYTYNPEGRPTHRTLYSGFVDLASPGMVEGDEEFGYDAAGRLEKAFNPLFLGNTVFTQYGHSDGGDLTSTIDENGRQDSRIYTALDQLERLDQIRTGPVTYTTAIGYDPRAEVSQVTDPALKATDYQRNDRGRLVRLSSPDTGTTLFRYDADGNLLEKIEDFGAGHLNRSTHYEYDGLDRLTRIDLPNDPDWIFTYDSDASKNQKGRLAQGSNGIVTTAYEYTDRGQVTRERTTIDGKSYDVVMTYDAAGNVRTLRSPGNVVTTTDYAGSRPKAVQIVAGPSTETIRNLEFWPFGPRTRAELPPYDSTYPAGNRVVSTRDYNLRGQVEEIDVTGPGGLVALDLSYTYHLTGPSPAPDDPGPNLDQVTDHRDASQSRFYFYEDLDRLWKSTDLSGSPFFTYGYDPAGNRLTETTSAGMRTSSYASGSDRLVGSSGPYSLYYASDAYGSRIYANDSPYAGHPMYVYNDENRLVELRNPDASNAAAARYTYDAFGRRVKKELVTGGAVTLFFYDARGNLLEQVAVDPGPDFLRRFVFVEGELLGLVDWKHEAGTAAGLSPLGLSLALNPQGLPGAALAAVVLALGTLALQALRRRPALAAPLVLVGTVLFSTACEDPPPAFSWVHTDPLGTPLVVTDTPADPATTPAKVIWRASYHPFGLATVSENPDGDGSSFRLNLRLPGQYFDAESGLHDNYFRTYDPATGRYLEADPIGQRSGLNAYSYAGSNPINLTDPSGLQVPPSEGDSTIEARIKHLVAQGDTK